MSDDRVDLPQGTLDLLILKTVALRSENGWAISKRIQQLSEQVLQVRQGSLYPALHRLEQRGLIQAEWGVSENNRKARFYAITAQGARHLEREAGQWQKLNTAVELILGASS